MTKEQKSPEQMIFDAWLIFANKQYVYEKVELSDDELENMAWTYASGNFASQPEDPNEINILVEPFKAGYRAALERIGKRE